LPELIEIFRTWHPAWFLCIQYQYSAVSCILFYTVLS